MIADNVPMINVVSISSQKKKKKKIHHNLLMSQYTNLKKSYLFASVLNMENKNPNHILLVYFLMIHFFFIFSCSWLPMWCVGKSNSSKIHWPLTLRDLEEMKTGDEKISCRNLLHDKVMKNGCQWARQGWGGGRKGINNLKKLWWKMVCLVEDICMCLNPSILTTKFFARSQINL